MASSIKLLPKGMPRTMGELPEARMIVPRFFSGGIWLIETEATVVQASSKRIKLIASRGPQRFIGPPLSYRLRMIPHQTRLSLSLDPTHRRELRP